MTHPYKSLPVNSYWSKSMNDEFQISHLISESKQEILKFGDRIVSAGSCFASNLVPFLDRSGFNYLRTEIYPSTFSDFTETLGYEKFSARYGFIYTARHLLQTYQKALNLFEPKERIWPTDKGFIDPFRPGLKFIPESEEEFEAIKRQHYASIRSAFEAADVFIFTLGLTEGWVSAFDGSVFPVCPGTVSGQFNANLHKFYNFEYSEIVSDLNQFIDLLRRFNPGVKFIFTVSPVHLVATAKNQHVLLSSIYSKSVLRAAVQKVIEENSNTFYFPSYEILTGPQALGRYIEKDLRNVTKEGVEQVMNLFIGAALEQNLSTNIQTPIEDFSEKFVKRECDEAFLDRPIVP